MISVLLDLARQGTTPGRLLSLLMLTQDLVSGSDAISLQQKLGHTTLAMTWEYANLAAQ